jgi:hypothetical protein
VATKFRSTETTTTCPVKGVVTVDYCSSAGGGTGILDGTIQRAGDPEPRDLLCLVTYDQHAPLDDPRDHIDGFSSPDEDGDMDDFEGEDLTLLSAVAEYYNGHQPMHLPLRFVSE